MNTENKKRNGFLALCRKYGHGKAVYIVRMAVNDRERKGSNKVLSVAQAKRETVRGWEAEAKEHFGIAY
jgi:hypothetical protein